MAPVVNPAPTRLRRFLSTLASSYALLASNILYSLASVPLALYFLSKPEFGLWALVTQILAYIALVDFGMSSSVARLLIDYKDRRESGEYGGFVKTGWLVLLVQGAIAGGLGFALSPLVGQLLAIPDELRAEFISLMRWQSALLVAMFAARMFGHLLYAHQRYDIVNYAQVAQQAAMFIALWLALAGGGGVMSVIWANATGWLLGAVITGLACVRLALFPHRGQWGAVSAQRFREMFAYGRDVFLVALGTQLIMASQTILITRGLGLETAAIWAVCTKTFQLLCQLIWKIFDFSVPALAEMLVRGERERLQRRFRQLVILSVSVSGLAAVGFALCNQTFVQLWTAGRIGWEPRLDALLAVWMIIQALVHCHSVFVLTTKQIGFMRWIYFFEGVVFVLLAAWGLRQGGVFWLIAASVASSCCFSAAYGLYRSMRYFALPARAVVLDWQIPLLKLLAALIPLACGLWWIGHALPPIPRLAVFVAGIGILGLGLLARLGLPDDVRDDLLKLAPARFQPRLRGLLGAPAPSSTA